MDFSHFSSCTNFETNKPTIFSLFHAHTHTFALKISVNIWKFNDNSVACTRKSTDIVLNEPAPFSQIEGH